MASLQNAKEVTSLIEKGKILILAGDEKIIRSLPKGNWIAGTIPYFMTREGGMKDSERIFSVDVSDIVKQFKIKNYSEKSIKDLSCDYYQNGFSYILMPAFSEIHKFYAENCYEFKNLFNGPLFGWVSGFDLDNKKQVTGKVINGLNKEVFDNEALILHLELNNAYEIKLDMINLFSQGNGDIITFPTKGLRVKECIINDTKQSFVKYIKENDIDITLPLVTYFNEERINVSFKEINEKDDYVEFYGPVFPGLEYQLASPVGIYEDEFEEEVKKRNINPLISCNCILNYLYANLEGKKTGNIAGPMTFGEISHVLLNQTMIFLELIKK